MKQVKGYIHEARTRPQIEPGLKDITTDLTQKDDKLKK